MRILILSNLFPPNAVGGYERLCAQVSAALSERGHDVVVLTSGYGSVESGRDSFPVRRELKLLADGEDIYKPLHLSDQDRSTILAGNARILQSALEEARPDVVFVWNLFFLGDSLLHVLGEARQSAIFFLTDNWLIAADRPDRIANFFLEHVHGGAPMSALAPYAVDRQLPHTAIFGAEFVSKLYALCGYEFVRSQVIHNGVTLPRPRPTPDRRRLIADGELRLLFAGRLVDLKGPQDAVAALPLIQRELPNLKVRLTLLGDRQDRSFARVLDDAVEASGLADQVRFAPPVAEAALPDTFNAHDIYLFPSRYEPFALTLIHALAAGIPTVASDAGGNGEIVLHGRTGLLFTLGDADSLSRRVVELAQSPVVRADVAARGRRLAYRFTFDRMLQQIEASLEAAHAEGRAAVIRN